jgi:peptidoglycan/LPS O-acetylase OafA/YrhL
MPNSRTGSAATPRLPAIEALRACAAFSVVAYHVALVCSFTRVGPLAPLFAELKAGVAVFFVISGFVLYLPYARAIAGMRSLPSWRLYVNRRAARILPAYWLALAILSLGPLHSDLIGPNGWRYFSLAQIYDSDTLLGGLGVAWSLCVEVSFYALLPVFAWALTRAMSSRRRTRAVPIQLGVLGAIAVAGTLLRVIVTRSAIAPVPTGASLLETALPGFLDWFACGMALAVVAGAWPSVPRPLPRLWALARRPGWCWALSIGCFSASALVQPQDEFLPLIGVGPHLLTGLGALLLVLPALTRATGARPAGVAKALEHPALIWLGTVSYGIYLWHAPVLQMIMGRLTPAATSAGPVEALGLFALVSVIAVGLGAASWYLIEQPVRRLLPNRPQKPRVEPAAAKTV